MGEGWVALGSVCAVYVLATGRADAGGRCGIFDAICARVLKKRDTVWGISSADSVGVAFLVVTDASGVPLHSAYPHSASPIPPVLSVCSVCRTRRRHAPQPDVARVPRRPPVGVPIVPPGLRAAAASGVGRPFLV